MDNLTVALLIVFIELIAILFAMTFIHARVDRRLAASRHKTPPGEAHKPLDWRETARKLIALQSRLREEAAALDRLPPGSAVYRAAAGQTCHAALDCAAATRRLIFSDGLADELACRESLAMLESLVSLLEAGSGLATASGTSKPSDGLAEDLKAHTAP